MVNVADFDIVIPDGDKLQIIFDRQRSLMDKYDPVEANNIGQAIPHAPLDIHDRFHQMRLKDFAWRITEELAEATECLKPANAETQHFFEEMIDALHFSVEFLILSNFTTLQIVGNDYLHGDSLEYLFIIQQRRHDRLDLDHPGHQDFIRRYTWGVVEALGISMNCLKNKPWKVTHMLTDENLYRSSARHFFLRFIKLMSMCGFDAHSLTKCYLNKNAVNQFRIRSHY